MIKTYNIVITKDKKNTPEVEEYLRKVFGLTWKLAANKYNETWLCGREKDLDLNDTIFAIKGLNKKITGVFITRVILIEAGYNNGSPFDQPTESETKPGSEKALDILMNNI